MSDGRPESQLGELNTNNVNVNLLYLIKETLIKYLYSSTSQTLFENLMLHNFYKGHRVNSEREYSFHLGTWLKVGNSYTVTFQLVNHETANEYFDNCIIVITSTITTNDVKSFN